jgi:hypothetical protein
LSSQTPAITVQDVNSTSGASAAVDKHPSQISLPLQRWVEESQEESPWTNIDTNSIDSLDLPEKDGDITMEQQSRL